MIAHKRFQIYRSDLETFGILENWSLRRDGRLREMVATEGSTIFGFIEAECADVDKYQVNKIVFTSPKAMLLFKWPQEFALVKN